MKKLLEIPDNKNLQKKVQDFITLCNEVENTLDNYKKIEVQEVS